MRTKKKIPPPLHHLPLTVRMTHDLAAEMRSLGHKIPERLVGYHVVLHKGRATERTRHQWPDASVNAVRAAVRSGERVQTGPAFMHYSVRTAQGLVGIGCNEYTPAEVLRVVGMSDRTVRNPKGRRTDRSTAIARNTGQHVPLVVHADGSVSFARTTSGGRMDESQPLDWGQPRCPREMVREIGRLASSARR